MIWEKKLALPARFTKDLVYRLILLAALCVQLIPASAANDGLGERWYFSGLTGESTLEPNTSNTQFTVGDQSDLALGFTLGYDLTRWLSLEGHAMDLGNARIDLGNTKAGKINYSTAGASLLSYLSFRPKEKIGHYQLGQREGFSLYGRIGVGLLDTFTELPSQQKQDLHVFFGAGIEYGWENGFAIRIEGTSYDEDAQVLGLGFVKRFGQAVERPGLPMSENPNIIAVETNLPPESIQSATQTITGLPLKKPTIHHKRKAFFELVLPIISFQRIDKRLVINAEDEPALIKLAGSLKLKKDLRLVVERYQPILSNEVTENTALTVIKFLVSHGLSPDQLVEAPPKSSKTNGLLATHRVEFSLAAQN